MRIHVLVGNHQKALDLLEALMKVPYHLTPGWLRIDPNFDPLRGNPRFDKLARGPWRAGKPKSPAPARGFRRALTPMSRE